MVSNAKPRGGTSWLSMLPGPPSQCTRQPRSRSASATARPGKMCPPVPPAMTRAHLAHAPASPHQQLVLVVDAQHDGQRDQVHQDRRAAVAHQRQGQSLGRQRAEVHAHVDEGLEADPDADALRHQPGEDAVQRDRLAADVHDAAGHPQEQARSRRSRRPGRTPRRSRPAGSRCALRAASAASRRCRPGRRRRFRRGRSRSANARAGSPCPARTFRSRDRGRRRCARAASPTARSSA